MTTQSQKPLFLFVFRSPQNQSDPTPEEMQKIFGAWMGWVKGLRDQGVYQAGDPLEEDGKMLRGPNGRNVTDGPFAEAKEIVGGYLIVTAENLDQATAVAKGCPGLSYGGSVEVRAINKSHGM